MFTLNGKVISIDSPFYDSATETNYSDLRDPILRIQLGVLEVPDQIRPTPEDHYFISTDTNGFEIYTPKSQPQINDIENGKIIAQIAQMETSQMLPRGMREFMIYQLEKEAIALGAAQSPPLDAATSLSVAYNTNILYKKAKDFDNQIVALRALLIK